MNNTESTHTFSEYFQGETKSLLFDLLWLALKEDGVDLTSMGAFPPNHIAQAKVVAKQETVVAGLPIVPLFIDLCYSACSIEKNYSWEPLKQDGDNAAKNEIIAYVKGNAQVMLRAERTVLNILGHLSGIATLTRKYVAKLEGSGVELLDTRKTVPGLRYPDKYAVLCGGGKNHRRNLEELLLIKDTHIDSLGSITQAVRNLKKAYNPCPPIEAECRTISEVDEAVSCEVERIMLDNMPIDRLNEALERIPPNIITEISGGVTLENISSLVAGVKRKPNYVSVGSVTNSAPCSDFSMLTIGNDYDDDTRK